jgi:ABC-type Mn2+/Zn2+ transport system ATPase subunit
MEETRAARTLAGEPLVLSLRGARIGYGARTVIDRVDWDVHAGETWFLLGPNGAGKTTLLRTLLGLLPLQAGRLERDPARASLARIGFVPQRCELSPSLPTTVREFVTLGLVGLSPAPRERGERLAEALDRAGLSGLEDRSYWALSGGQRQRALVARALVRRPALLILDEPTEGLDPPTEAAFLDLVAALQREQGVTVLFVTHRLAVAARRASHVALVDAGALVVGPRASVLRRPEMQRAFGASLEGLA